jgi:hypothetical protein
VESLIEIAGILGVKPLIHPVIGLFQETLPITKNKIGRIGLLHLDGDWYDSTKAILENLYKNAVKGAYMQVDDYGHWEGCKKAVDEYLLMEKYKPQLHVIDNTGVWFKKE